MRPIDADALMNSLEQPFNWTETPEEIQEVADYNRFVKAIAEAPTIDAELVRHGRWIDAGDFTLCSVCQSTHMKEIETFYGKATRLWIKTNYCPDCGAKMDRGFENDETR